MEKNQNRIEETLKEIQQRKGRPARIREPPGCFPFTVLDNLLNFGDVDQQTYDNVVSHFYLGDINPTDSAGHYFKCAFGDNEDIGIFSHYLTGYKISTCPERNPLC
ncbi:neurofilament medium polypeptide-like protein [Lasius niger]|uniref:Neurofilament medium polypeptide-like protein n=2 Tax=Lasius TaxID=488720 RepID=A0A0J7K295_LASNI|nr:neurofilament medium polypeptide-like protein [Lasius niger]